MKVRAVVRELSDDQLVVSQGQENNARTNLSYIERALFASRLDDRGFSRDIAMAALGVDKAALSKMLIITRQIPLELVIAIGPAPEIGRRRWLEFSEHVKKGNVANLIAMLAQDDAQQQTSDQRFQLALNVLMKTEAPRRVALGEVIGGVPVKIRKTGSGSTFVFTNKGAPGFDDFVKGKLESLFSEFKQTAGD
jgi:ParB family chromosome partitioning protein